MNRVKSSSDVVGAVLRELRLQAGGEGAFKLAVAVDGVNALWGKTSLKKEDRTVVCCCKFAHVEYLCMTSFIKMCILSMYFIKRISLL